MNKEEEVIDFLKNDNKKVIFLINLKSGLDGLGNFFNKSLCNVSSPSSAVFFGMEIPEYLAWAGSNITVSEDYLAREDYENIDRYVFGEITKSWYLYKDTTVYRGMHLGKVFEYDFQKYLVPRIKNLEIIKNAVTKEKAGKIVIIDDGNELADAAVLYAGLVNMPILRLFARQDKGRFLGSSSKFRAVLSDFLRGILDVFSYRFLIARRSNKGFILVDAKLHKYFKGRDDKASFIVCLFEGGVFKRLDLIRKKILYLPLYFKKSKTCLEEWAAYRKRWEDLSADENFKSIFKYNNIPIWGIVSQKIAAFFQEGMPRIVGNINLLGDSAEAKNIKIAILRNDVKELERTLILGLRLQKIPSLVMQHGILAEPNGHNVLLADRFAAWGRAALDWYGKSGNPPERFDITGNPLFDRFLNWTPEISRKDLCNRLNLKEDKGIVLFVTQQISKFSSFWTDDLFPVITGKLLEAMRLFPDKQLVIKADPYESLAPYKKRIDTKQCSNAVAVRGIDIYTLIYFSELVITQDSTAGLEAMIFDKPVISINLTKRGDRVPYAEKGAAIGVYKAADLAPAISRALTDRRTIDELASARKTFIDEYAYKLDGKAAARSINLVERCSRN